MVRAFTRMQEAWVQIPPGTTLFLAYWMFHRENYFLNKIQTSKKNLAGGRCLHVQMHNNEDCSDGCHKVKALA